MMNQDVSFGNIIKEYRKTHDLTQAELARRVGCATITIRKIEADALRPSVQIAERLAMALNIPLAERARFVRLARSANLSDSSPSPLPTPPLIPSEVGLEDLSGRAIRGYELGERLAMGGFGAVYRCLQPLLEREVAVKIILPQYANHPDFIRRFEAEAQLVARLEHPYIVPLYDFWREPGVAYLVMRLMRGGSLHGRLKNGPLSLEAAVRLLQQMGAALHNAHRAGVIHRDIKPANILLDEDNNAYLADFGFAKNLGNPNLEDQSQAGTVVGSLEYISPEQIQAEPVRPQADIYCLGITFYEMLTGQKPFKGPTPIDFIQQHMRDPLPSLASTPSGSPDKTALDPVIARATHKNPDQRYPDVLAMLEDVRQCLSGETAPASAASRLPSAILSLPPLELENPYKGLRAFGEADADNFFGRDSLVQELLGHLSDDTELARFLAVVGPSGSGKSSLVKAGLVPALRRGGLPGSENWFIVDFMPGAHPLEELEAALLRVATNPPDSLLAQLRQDERGLLRAIKRILPADENVELVLVIDQFEELFTLVEEETRRAHFLALLVTALLDERSRLRLIITLRADYIDRPLQYVDFGEMLRQRTEFVLPLNPDELEQAITQPAVRLGLTWESGLVATIIKDVGDQPGMLPLLQYTLTELFDRREGRRLTPAAYQAGGGVPGTLAHRADEIFTGLDEAGQTAACQLFLRLVTPGEGAGDTRRRVLRTELEELITFGSSKIQNPKSKIQNGVDLFGRHRLLTFDRDPLTRMPTVEVAHEALIREWGRLRGWLADSRADIRWQRLLAAATHEWLQAERDPDYLLHGSRLAQFEDWAADTELALTTDERAFLQASVAERDRQQAEEESRRQRELETAQKLAATERARAEEQSRAAGKLRQRAVYLTGALIIAGLLAVAAIIFGQQASQNAEAAQAEANTRATAQAVAELQQKEAERQARIATARELAAAAVANLDVDPERSILLALQAVSTTLEHDDIVMPEAESVLHRAIATSRVVRSFIGHTDGIYGLDLSPDGSHMVTASDDGTAKIWDTATGQELFSLTGHIGWVDDAVFSPDGRLVATAGHDQMIKLWDAATGQELQSYAGHNDAVLNLAFSPDGRLLASAGFELILFDLITGQSVGTYEGEIRRVILSPNGEKLATGDNDGLVQVWDVETSQLLLNFPGHTGRIDALAFSPDGQLLASTGQDGTVKVWDVEGALNSNTQTGTELYTFRGHVSQVRDVDFSPDGTQLASASWDGTVKIWDAATGREMLTLLGHAAGPTGVAFSPDGTWLATTSADTTARIWRLTPPAELLTLPDVEASGNFAISPDGTTVVAGHRDGTLRAWNIEAGQELPAPVGHPEWINSVTFSPDGTRLATASDDFTAKVWDTATNQELLTLVGHTDLVWDVAFSPDGTQLATASGDATVKVWDTATGQELLTLTDFAGTVERVGFSPDGTRLATTSNDGLVKLFDAETGTKLMEMDHGLDMWGLVFSEDGGKLVTGGLDNLVKIWDANSGEELLTLTGHTSLVSSIAFSPDGRRLATGSADTTVKLWDATTGREELTLDNGDFEVFLVHFSDDGKHLVVGAEDGLRVYTLDINELITLAQSRLTRSLTEAECRQYLHVDRCPGG